MRITKEALKNLRAKSVDESEIAEAAEKLKRIAALLEKWQNLNEWQYSAILEDAEATCCAVGRKLGTMIGSLKMLDAITDPRRSEQ